MGCHRVVVDPPGFDDGAGLRESEHTFAEMGNRAWAPRATALMLRFLRRSAPCPRFTPALMSAEVDRYLCGRCRELGCIVCEKKVLSEPEAITLCLFGLPGSFERVVLEAGPLA